MKATDQAAIMNNAVMQDLMYGRTSFIQLVANTGYIAGAVFAVLTVCGLFMADASFGGLFASFAMAVGSFLVGAVLSPYKPKPLNPNHRYMKFKTKCSMGNYGYEGPFSLGQLGTRAGMDAFVTAVCSEYVEHVVIGDTQDNMHEVVSKLNKKLPSDYIRSKIAVSPIGDEIKVPRLVWLLMNKAQRDAILTQYRFVRLETSLWNGADRRDISMALAAA